MRIQKRQADDSIELWTGEGSWFWQLRRPSNSGGIVGAAPSADEAVRDACAALEEVGHGDGSIESVSALLESALTWSGALEGFRRAAASVC